MLAVYAKFTDGSIDMIGFVNDAAQAEAAIEKYITRHGADYLGSRGVQFNVELAA